MKNLAFHSLLRCKMIVLPTLTTLSYTVLFTRLGECSFWAWEWKGKCKNLLLLPDMEIETIRPPGLRFIPVLGPSLLTFRPPRQWSISRCFFKNTRRSVANVTELHPFSNPLLPLSAQSASLPYLKFIFYGKEHKARTVTGVICFEKYSKRREFTAKTITRGKWKLNTRRERVMICVTKTELCFFGYFCAAWMANDVSCDFWGREGGKP